MGALEMLMELALFGLPILAAFIFAAAFLSGRIKSVGLLSDEQGANSPARWQLLFTSVAGALSYLGTVLTTDTGSALPELPGWFTSALVTSNSIYLVGKATGLGVFRSAFQSLTRLGRT